MQACVLFGGSFDPVHFGHLRMAEEVSELLQGAPVKLMPSPAQAQKRHHGSLRQRSDMLRLALQTPADSSRLELDLGEQGMAAEGAAVFTVDTLRARREQIGPQTSLIFLLGMDAFLGLQSWSRWQQLPKLAHLLVFRRPGSVGTVQLQSLFEHEAMAGRLTDNAQHLLQSSAGCVYLAELSELDISSTRIRAEVAAGRSARFLTTDSVLSYIAENGLYRSS